MQPALIDQLPPAVAAAQLMQFWLSGKIPMTRKTRLMLLATYLFSTVLDVVFKIEPWSNDPKSVSTYKSCGARPP
jgi:hypothetical protein